MLLFQWCDSDELSLLPHVFPVIVEFSFMEARPLLDEILGISRIDLTIEQLAVKIESCILSLVFRMEVRRIVIAVEHANDYT